MHELHYKILSVNQECFSIISSVEEPFIYLIGRFKITEVEKFTSLRYRYALELIELVDDWVFIKNFFVGKSFRLKSEGANKFWDKTLNFDVSLCENGKDVAEEFNRFVDYDKFFISLAPLVFEDLSSCREALNTYELTLAKKWANDLRHMSSRREKAKN